MRSVSGYIICVMPSDPQAFVFTSETNKLVIFCYFCLHYDRISICKLVGQGWQAGQQTCRVPCRWKRCHRRASFIFKSGFQRVLLSLFELAGKRRSQGTFQLIFFRIWSHSMHCIQTWLKSDHSDIRPHSHHNTLCVYLHLALIFPYPGKIYMPQKKHTDYQYKPGNQTSLSICQEQWKKRIIEKKNNR